jgi:hypothetical protein
MNKVQNSKMLLQVGVGKSAGRLARLKTVANQGITE